MKLSKILLLTGAVLPFIVMAQKAQAQTILNSNYAGGDVSGYVYLGAGITTEYEGSEDYEAFPFAGGRIEYDEFYAQIKGTALQFNVVPSQNFQGGPVINYRVGRDDNLENQAVERLGEIDDAVEVGAFARYESTTGWRGGDSLGFEVQALTDMSDTHDGYIVSASADYNVPVTDKLVLGADISTSYVSDDYNETYFGVSASGAAASGLQQFNAEGGFKDVTLGFNARYAINERWGVFSRVQYTELVGDAADSSIVEDAGSSSQFLAGTGISYRF